MQYHLRPSSNLDEKWLDILRRDVYKDLFFATWGKWDEERHARHFKSCLNQGHIFIIEINGNGAGMIQIFQQHGFTEIAEIQISKAYRGQGLGTQIIRDIISKSKNSGKKTTLSTGIQNKRALNLYKKLGLKETKRTEEKIYMETNG